MNLKRNYGAEKGVIDNRGRRSRKDVNTVCSSMNSKIKNISNFTYVNPETKMCLCITLSIIFITLFLIVVAARL